MACIDIVLVLLFHAWVQPVTILGALILSIPGAILALFVTGTDPSLRAPMAIGVISGLITSTFLSLLVIPVLYEVVDDAIQRFSRKRGIARSELVSA